MDELLFDVVASLYNRNSILEFIKETAKISIPLTVGGGIRKISDIPMFLRQVDKVALTQQ